MTLIKNQDLTFPPPLDIWSSKCKLILYQIVDDSELNSQLHNFSSLWSSQSHSIHESINCTSLKSTVPLKSITHWNLTDITVLSALLSYQHSSSEFQIVNLNLVEQSYHKNLDVIFYLQYTLVPMMLSNLLSLNANQILTLNVLILKCQINYLPN